ncbi:RNA-directed DNA polymerase, eukaryota [Tanacetum coccineum]
MLDEIMIRRNLAYPLENKVPFQLEQLEEDQHPQFKELTDLLIPIVLNPCPDRWFWSLEGSGEFSVASIRRFIDDQRLLTMDSKTLWIKSVPIKVNILAWKIKLEALPTRFNISRRVLEIDSILCPLCDRAVESTRHIFISSC